MQLENKNNLDREKENDIAKWITVPNERILKNEGGDTQRNIIHDVKLGMSNQTNVASPITIEKV